MVWISVKNCFPGQTSCQRNAESNFNDMLLFGAVVYVGVPTMERLQLKNFSIEISALQKAYDDSELRPELTIKKYLIVQNEDIYHV